MFPVLQTKGKNSNLASDIEHMKIEPGYVIDKVNGNVGASGGCDRWE